MDKYLDALLAILLLKKLLVECFRVFNNPVKMPQWTLPLITELKEFSSPLSAHLLNAHLAKYPLRTSNSFVLLLCTYAPAQCPLGRALGILNDSDSS
jgi:hypothetical protein